MCLDALDRYSDEMGEVEQVEVEVVGGLVLGVVSR